MKGHPYWPELDGIRGIAILGVLLLHFTYGFFFRGGFLGVDLFFALSGFLITTLLLKEWNRSRHINLGRFYIRRILRLYPALVVTVILAYFLWPQRFEQYYWRAAIAALFYHANLYFLKSLRMPIGILGHTWSLSIEEQFYLLWPPLLLVILRMGRRFRLTLTLLAIFASIGVRLILLHSGEDYITANRFTFARTDALLCGSLAALWLDGRSDLSNLDRKSSRVPEWVCFGCMAVLFCLFSTTDLSDTWLITWGYTGVAFLCATMVTSASLLRTESLVARFLRTSVMKYLGTRSYGLYLYNFPIFVKLEDLRRPHSTLNLILVSLLRVVATFLLTELSFRLIERPFLSLKSRFEPAVLAERNPPLQEIDLAAAKRVP